MTKTELESKHLAELHALAAEAGIERYRMLGRAELIEKLSDGGGGGASAGGSRRSESSRSGGGREERPRRQRRDEKPREGRNEKSRQRRDEKPRERRPRERRERAPEAAAPSQQSPAPPAESAASVEPAAPVPAAGERPKRRRRRRRWGRRRKGLRVHDLLLPADGARQSIVYAESRETCTALLREVAAELADASKGPDPIALLIDPTPEELADWRRDAPQCEIVAAGKAHHADDAIAQAGRRAEGGENVIVLIDSLSRFAESYGDADGARDLLQAALSASSAPAGSVTVVAALERPSS